jgi:large conductance mechanosensitive channel
MLSEFKAFLLRGNVVDLAVAVVIGTAFTAVVSTFVVALLTPLVAALFGKPDFSELAFTINDSRFRYGAFINSVITFLSVAAAVFFLVVKPMNMLAARRRRGDEPPPEPTEDILILRDIRELLRDRG